MPVYRRILLAVDLTADSALIGQRARALATALDGTLEMIHVVEPVPPVAPYRRISVCAITMSGRTP
jgi:hypothetical protein